MRDGTDVGDIVVITSIRNSRQTRFSSQVDALNKENHGVLKLIIKEQQTLICSFVNIVTHSSIIFSKSVCFLVVKSNGDRTHCINLFIWLSDWKRKEIIPGGNISNWERILLWFDGLLLSSTGNTHSRTWGNPGPVRILFPSHFRLHCPKRRIGTPTLLQDGEKWLYL